MDKQKFKLFISVFVASLGYFVDVFDIVLFSIVRVSSLKDLGLGENEILTTGVKLYNIQLLGMLVGGMIWGVIGDKFGRVKVLFGSIILYSLANIGNSLSHSPESYGFFRFLAGLGLSGEVGGAVTLVAEITSRKNRGWSTTIVATAGTCGALAASVFGQLMHWRTAYFVGGILGLFLLFSRIYIHESGMFEKLLIDSKVKKGRILQLLESRESFLRYLTCILAGLPLFFSMYVLIAFCPEIGKALKLDGALVVAKATFYFTIAMTLGDVAAGALSQMFKSRKKILFLFVSLSMVSTFTLLFLNNQPAGTFYLFCIPAGFFCGYWVVYVTTVSEQFGTNIRSTVVTSALNFVRATPIAMNYFFMMLNGYTGLINSMLVTGIITYAVSFYFISRFKESYSADLDFVEN